MIALSNTEITKAYLGSTEISKMYLGEELVFGGDSPTPVLPYDAQVEYLQSSGTQYIDTGVYINGATTELRMQYSGFTNQYFACGCRTAYNDNAFIFSNGGTNYKTYTRYFLNYGTSYIANKTCPNDAITHELIMTNVVKIDGTTIHTFTATNFTTNRTFWLFGSNNNDGVRYGSMKIYSFKIYNSNSLVMDLIPVRVEEVGYMYDKKNKVLLGNSGSGNFIIGNDITT